MILQKKISFIFSFNIKLFCIVFFLFYSKSSTSQESTFIKLDSLERLLSQSKMDTIRLSHLEQLAQLWQYKDLIKSTEYTEQAYALARKLDLTERSYGIMYGLAYNYMALNNAPKSIEILQELIHLLHDREGAIVTATAFISLNYKEINDLENALIYGKKSFEINEKLQVEKKEDFDHRGYYGGPINIAEIYEKMNQLDSALYYSEMSYQRLLKGDIKVDIKIFEWQIPWIYGKVQFKSGQKANALNLYKEALTSARSQEYDLGIQPVEMSLAQYFISENNIDSAKYYALKAFEGAMKVPNYSVISEAGFLLKSIYAKEGNIQKAYYYLDQAHAAKDTISGIKKMQQVQALTIKEMQRQADIETERTKNTVRLRQYLLLSSMLFLLVLAVFLYINNRQKQKLNVALSLQKLEISTLNDDLEMKVKVRTEELRKALDEVQSAFSQGQTTERKRVSADLHDEIGSALSTIAMYSDVVKMKAQKTAPQLVNDLDKIGQKSRDMVQTMRDTIWTLNEENQQSLWERMYTSAMDTVMAKGIQINMKPMSDNCLSDLPFNSKRHLFLAFKEAINNIVKHANAALITVETHLSNDQLLLEVRDNGKGFEMEKVQTQGNGLQNFQHRMSEIGGAVRIESSPGKGTSVVFTIPLST